MASKPCGDCLPIQKTSHKGRLFVLVIPTGFFLLISSFLANSLRSLVLYYFFRRITPAQKFNKTSPLAVKTTGASVVFILEPIITKVIWLRNHVGIYYQYKKTSHKERLFCIGDPNGIRTHITTVKG